MLDLSIIPSQTTFTPIFPSVDSTVPTAKLQGQNTPINNASFTQQANSGQLDKDIVSIIAAFAAQKSVVALSTAAVMPNIKGPTAAPNPGLINKQIELLRVTVSSVPSEQSRQIMGNLADDFTVQAEKAKINIISISNGFTGRAANILQTVIETSLEVRKSTTELGNMSRELAHEQNRHSSELSISAAKTNTTMAISQGIISSTMSLAGGFRSAQGLKTQSNAVKIHGQDALKHKHHAAELDTRRMTGTPQNACDTERLSETPNYQRREQGQQEIYEKDLTIAGQVQQNQGQIAMGCANGMAAVAVAQGHTAMAVAQAGSSNATTDKEMHTSLTEAQTRMADQENQLKAALMELLMKTMTLHSDTISTMTNNLKG
ncbi:hypothetical protein [Yersinia kristensenii]|uniref:hypothetical protein n=1 Tax=Yersinia kristensenii TaxID=28152 RepID=UPI0005E2BD78|nr:hypothetical protein [Yersinia kristensenii]CNF38036.1 Uncharacterised protein [Yersinia kristensenii]